MIGLVDKTLAIHRALASAEMPHAFGGAIALAYHVRRPRATNDIDVAVFVKESNARSLPDALPDGIVIPEENLQDLERDGQTRLHWDGTEIDVFLSTMPIHEYAARRVTHGLLQGVRIPILSALDTALFKALFNRDRDWVDIAAVRDAGNLDGEGLRYVRQVLLAYVGEHDSRILRLDRLAESGHASPSEPTLDAEAPNAKPPRGPTP